MNSKTREKLKKFTCFLKENNCYNEYFNNYNIEFAMLSFVYLLDHNYKGLFYSAFVFSETKEGHKFWHDLDNKWNNYINEKN